MAARDEGGGSGQAGFLAVHSLTRRARGEAGCGGERAVGCEACERPERLEAGRRLARVFTGEESSCVRTVEDAYTVTDFDVDGISHELH